MAKYSEAVRRKPLALMIALTAVLGLLFTYAGAARAQNKELRVMCSDGMKAALEALTPQIEKATGYRVIPHFDSSNGLKQKIEGGEAFDVAILTSGPVDDLIKQGKISAGSRTDIARTGMGVGVKAGAPKPDVSTSEALKRTLLKASSVSFNPSGASAAYIDKMLVKLGIAEQMKPKFMLDAEPGRPQMNVADGKAELVITLIPEIKFFKGVELAGPLPADLQSYINFSAGVASKSEHAAAGAELLKFITSTTAAPILREKALEPH